MRKMRPILRRFMLVVAVLVIIVTRVAQASQYGPPTDAGPPAKIIAVREATLAAGLARGWAITRANVFVVVVRDQYAVAWVGYKGAIGAVLRETAGTWHILSWNAAWGGGDTTMEQLLTSGVPVGTAQWMAAKLTPHVSPQVLQYNDHIQAGNKAALAGDLSTAISQYEWADVYAQSQCEHEMLKINVAAAQQTLALVNAGKLSADQASSEYWARAMGIWRTDPCNRP